MTGKEKIEQLEHRVSELEALLKETVRLVDELADAMLKHIKTHTGCS